MKQVCLFILFSFFFAVTTKASVNYGLRFNSYDVLASDRTGILLEDGKAIDVSKELTLSFDLQFRKRGELYGSIVRIISESSSLINLGFSTEGSMNSYPVLVINDEITPLTSEIKYDKWLNVSITISNVNQTITLKFDSFTKTFSSKPHDWDQVRICFGKCKVPGFSTEEVPYMDVRDIKLTRNDRLFRHWKLNAHADSCCYDQVKGVRATVLDPVWIIDSYTNWSKTFSLLVDENKGIQYAFDPSNDIIYLVPDEKSVIAYHVGSAKEEKIEVKGGYPAGNNTNQLIFNPVTQELISYNLDLRKVSVFSFDTQSWSGNKPEEYTPSYWHHTSVFRPADASVIAFGGYGFHQYKNELISSVQPDRWDMHKLASVSPRYSSASAIVDDTLFIFSGEGNRAGKQEIITNVTTDLYAVDLKTLEVSLKWEIPNVVYGLPCGNMIYDHDNSCFYVLVDKSKNRGQSILKISKNKPEVEELSSISSMALDADYNFYTLMKPEKKDTLYALFCRNYKTNSSRIDIYDIAYPPISPEQTKQLVKSHPAGFGSLIYPVSIALLAGILFAGLFVWLKKRNKNGPQHVMDHSIEEEKHVIETTAQKNVYFNRALKSISLLGLFSVRDRDGNDITGQFTPVLKNIVLAVILNTNEDMPGVNSKVINNLIWPDKDDKAARNNRNVSMNRLNIVLEKIGEVQVSNQNSFWKLSVNDNTFCDYLVVSKLMKLPRQQIMGDEELTAQLLELLSFGQLLPFTRDEWLDPYKAAYTDFALDFLLGILSKEETLQNDSFGLYVSNLIFLFDSLNEEALAAKCKLLYKQGKKSLAKSAYDSFCKEYETLLGEKYLVPLVKIIE